MHHDGWKQFIWELQRIKSTGEENDTFADTLKIVVGTTKVLS